MTRLFTNRRLLALLFSIIVLAGLVSLTIKDRNKITWPEKLVLDSVSWMQHLLYVPVAHLSGYFEDIQQITSIYQENQLLKKNMINYASMNSHLTELEKENQRLRTMLDFKSKTTDYKMWPANVTGRSLDRWNSTITIDKGQKDGVIKDMAVISGDGGLIGRVSAVGTFSSEVVLITDSNKSGISARVQESDAVGIVTGSTNQFGGVEMGLIDREAKIEKGNHVVTSGLSDLFPKGIMIGTVTDISVDETGLMQSVKIKPAANLNNLQEVFVVQRVDQPNTPK